MRHLRHVSRVYRVEQKSENTIMIANTKVWNFTYFMLLMVTDVVV